MIYRLSKLNSKGWWSCTIYRIAVVLSKLGQSCWSLTSAQSACSFGSGVWYLFTTRPNVQFGVAMEQMLRCSRTASNQCAVLAQVGGLALPLTLAPTLCCGAIALRIGAECLRSDPPRLH